MRISALTGCAVLLCCGGAFAAQSELDALMANYTAALGGRAAMAKIHSSMTVYKCTLGSHTIRLTTTTKTPFYYLQVVETAGVAGRTSFGFDGKTAWQQNPDGSVITLTGERRAELISDAAGANSSEIFTDRWPTTVTLGPAETVEGRSYEVLSIRPKDGIEHDVLIDPQSGIPMVDRSVENNLTVLNVAEAFGRGPEGELQPRIMVSRRSDGAPAILSVLREAQDNGPVSTAIFAPPLDARGSQSI